MRPKVGDIVEIVLYDHADFEGSQIVQGEDLVLVFECFGRLIKETRLDYRLMRWGNPKDWYLDSNNEYFSILKSAVKSIRRLK